MASPQWKNFQPSAQDSATHSHQRSPSFNNTSNDDCLHDSNSSSPSGMTPRETGIVEKLLHSYGFIQCCERQARLFFHYSQYTGTIEHLKVGDAVEFEMTYDRRTGKPIASAVSKITPECGEVMCEERVSGFITTEVKDNCEGRVAYESRGECFFLPYCADDVDVNIELCPSDKVTFRLVTDPNTGNLRACDIKLEKPQPIRYQGVICALKETFGFIERADVVKEIFFHSSECKSFRDLTLGDDVEFSVQTRNNKEVAVNVVTLPLGTVVFEDTNHEIFIGEIKEALKKDPKNRSSDALPGKIQCQVENEVRYYPFGERDPKVEYTLQVGDWVQFNVATDRRDNLQRATNIELVFNSLTFSKEKREQGYVTSLKESYGFINHHREPRLYFRFSELLNSDETIKVHDEVEFTMIPDPSSPGRFQALRVQMLPPGTVSYASSAVNGSKSDELVDNEHRYIGIVEKESPSRWSSDSPQKANKKSHQEENNGNTEEGVILVNRNGTKEKVYYTTQDCEPRSSPRVGDKVEFVIIPKEDKLYALHVRVMTKIRNGFRYSHRGFIAALKETFGFIETEDHDKEVFFHYSVFDGNASNLEVGQEVEFGMTHKGNKLSAECVRKLPSGTITKDEIQPEVLNGVILNPVRCFNPDQDHYAGKVRVASHGEDVDEKLLEYEYGITSLVDKHEFLQKGDVVQFQIGITKKGKERAVNIKAIRARIQATVDTIKGNFGFLAYEVEEGKKLFFHMSEVKGEGLIQAGDKVEFVIVHHQRTGKYSACSVVKIGESTPLQRPERLNRLRTISNETSGPKLILIRQPKGPDGSCGFKIPRNTKQGKEENMFSSFPEENLPNGIDGPHNTDEVNQMSRNLVPVYSQG